MNDLAALVARALASDDASRMLDELADRIAHRVTDRISAGSPSDGWLDSSRAADYLGMSRDALHRLTSERRIAFSQERSGGKCWFKRAHLDAFREADLRTPLVAGEPL